MNIEQTRILQLIKKSQFGSAEHVSVDDIDLDALYEEASVQAVLGLIAPELPIAYSEKEKWKEAQYRQMASYIRYCHSEDELKRILDEAKIPFVILKGNSAAIGYIDATRRSMGDIDFLVPQDLYEHSKEVLNAQGYVEIDDNGRHVEYKKDGMIFELHHHFSHDIDIEDYLIDGLKQPLVVSIDSHMFPMLPKLANGLVLLDHMRRHLKSGLGLRQVIDWMMYVYRNLDDDFWNKEFGEVAKKKGMDILAVTATRMCQLFLGLPETITWCKSADEKLCEQLMDCLLVSGNFGRKNAQGNSIETVSTTIKRNGLFRWLQHAGEYNWAAYHKHHWLKPFCWFYQIFRYAKQGLKTGRNKEQLKGDLERSKDRYDLLKKLNIA